MIQFKRGKSSSWSSQKTPLADGQPGYDKDRHKIKIGDGKSSWDELPSASGMTAEEILDSEENAKAKAKALAALNPIGSLIAKALKIDDRTVITYGTEAPDANTIGRVYLQHYDAEPEVDYVIETGVDGIWTYQIWKSGTAKCWGTLNLTTEVTSAVGNGFLFINNTSMNSIKYPFIFNKAPSETVTLSSATGKVAWLAGQTKNSATASGIYSILSYDKQVSAEYNIVFDVKGKISKPKE